MSFSGSSFGNYSKKWLIGIGILELVLAAIFVFVGFGLSTALGGFGGAGASGMFLTAAILGTTGIILIVIGVVVGRRAAATGQILQTGIPGMATITGLTQTGMYLNEQPQIAMGLMVQLPGRAPYAAQHKSFVPLLLLSRLTSGAPLAVRVDPADPQKVVVDWQSAPQMPMAGYAQPIVGYGQQLGQPMASYGQPMASYGQPMPGQPMAGQPTVRMSSAGTGSVVDESLGQVQAALAASGMQAANPYALPGQANVSVEQLRAYLRASGIEGTARIDKLTDSGQIVGDERLYTMQVTLQLPGKPPLQTSESAAMVPLRAMHKMRVGADLPVRVDPNNSNLMMFDWDKI